MGSVDACRLIDLPRLDDTRGSLSFVEPPMIPFEIGRVYYLYETRPGASRGAHGHRELEQLMIVMAGAVDVDLDDGRRRQHFRLSRPDQGLYISPMIWRDLRDFAPGTICVVLASHRFAESDYFRNYQDFLAAADPT